MTISYFPVLKVSTEDHPPLYLMALFHMSLKEIQAINRMSLFCHLQIYSCACTFTPGSLSSCFQTPRACSGPLPFHPPKTFSRQAYPLSSVYSTSSSISCLFSYSRTLHWHYVSPFHSTTIPLVSTTEILKKASYTFSLLAYLFFIFILQLIPFFLLSINRNSFFKVTR